MRNRRVMLRLDSEVWDVAQAVVAVTVAERVELEGAEEVTLEVESEEVMPRVDGRKRLMPRFS